MGQSTSDSAVTQTVSADEVLDADELQLRAQGHKGELPRQFSTLATLALAFSITNSWVGYSATFSYPLYAGGGPTVFWGLLTAAVACTIITAGLAEIASAFPSSGGQYHFAFMVSPPHIRAPVAFIMGWLSVLAWGLTTASAVIFDAQICISVASLRNPDYVATQWQVWMVSTLFMIIVTAIVCLLPRILPKAETAFFLCSLAGFIIFTIAVLATSKPKQPGSVVFTDFVNQTGWSDGTAFVLGVGTCTYAFLGTDATTHIAEELPSPGKAIPRVMLLTMAIGIVTSVIWTMAFMFSTSELDDVATSPLPIYTVYLQALRSEAGATVFACWLLWVYFGASIGCIATTGRLAWAFARDNGLPFSKTLAKVHPTLRLPVNATLVCMVFVILYTLIYIGSTTAFNSIVSMAVWSLNVTYAIPQGIVLFYGRNKVLPRRQFTLGTYLGPCCNAFSCLWVLLYTVLFCFPLFYPPEVGNMNYVSVVIAGVILIIVVFWFAGKRKTFVGPNVNLEGMEIAQAIVTMTDQEAKAKRIKELAHTTHELKGPDMVNSSA